jgi:cytochrome subunit of sulfide dehydrogenase
VKNTLVMCTVWVQRAPSKLLSAALACTSLLITPLGYAQGSQQLYVKALAATCANCHGTNGKSVEGSAMPSLTGLSKDYIVSQMKAFQSGARPATIMHQLSKGYSEAQIEQIAAYFAAQKK